MIKVIIEFELVYPYKISMSTLAEFCFVWDCLLMSGGTNRMKAIISMPGKVFKKIFGTNPREKEYPIPRGMEKFISKVVVSDIIV
jgi:hypothetical protein